MKKSKSTEATQKIKNKSPKYPIGFNVDKELHDLIIQTAAERKQTKATVLRSCIKESLNSDIPSEVYHYIELSDVLNNQSTTDKQKIEETKKIIKELIKLRGTCYE